jgi:isopenicillin N synthase-like dioxygenase
MKVLKSDLNSSDASKNFVKSLRETGFGVLENHSVDVTLLRDVYEEWGEYFKKSQDCKNKDIIVDKSGAHQNGYYPPLSENAKGNREKDLKEFYQYYKKYSLPIGLSKKTNILFEQMEMLAVVLLNWVEELTPSKITSKFSEPLSQMVLGSPNTLLRIINYPPIDGSEDKGAIRAAAHGDINFITILPAATESGLQVRGVDQKWYDVDTNAGNLVVNTGDMLSRLTNGYYPSTIHRVVNPEEESLRKKSRMSMPLFLHARPEVFLDEETKVQDFLNERLREIGLIK